MVGGAFAALIVPMHECIGAAFMLFLCTGCTGSRHSVELHLKLGSVAPCAFAIFSPWVLPVLLADERFSSAELLYK